MGWRIPLNNQRRGNKGKTPLWRNLLEYQHEQPAKQRILVRSGRIPPLVSFPRNPNSFAKLNLVVVLQYLWRGSEPEFLFPKRQTLLFGNHDATESSFPSSQLFPSHHQYSTHPRNRQQLAQLQSPNSESNIYGYEQQFQFNLPSNDFSDFYSQFHSQRKLWKCLVLSLQCRQRTGSNETYCRQYLSKWALSIAENNFLIQRNLRIG